MTERSLSWAHGRVEVQSLGGMAGPISFRLPDGREVQPMQLAPWADEPGTADLPGILRRLRGEWPCVPFGADAPRDMPAGWAADGMTFDGATVPHGHGAHVDWQFLEPAPDAITLVCDYPDIHPIKSLHRTLRPDPERTAIDITLTVRARRPCRLPIGLHPTFRLPESGKVELVPPAFGVGRVFPMAVDASSRLLPDAVFLALDAVPAIDGGTISLTRLPLDSRNEDLVQLCGVTGDVVLRHPGEGFQVRLGWNTAQLPSLLLWISNRGRTGSPWNGRHLAIGIEPVCSAFDLGPAVSTGTNPIAASGVATAMEFVPDRPFTTTCRIAVEPLGTP
jgi:hypothetical protein